MKGEIHVRSVQIIAPDETISAKERVPLDPNLRSWICSLFAAFGIFGGLASLFIGLVLIVIHSLISSDQIFDRVGTGLLIVAIPMILIGSVFLDWIKKD